jgi:hypothetical protein
LVMSAGPRFFFPADHTIEQEVLGRTLHAVYCWKKILSFIRHLLCSDCENSRIMCRGIFYNIQHHLCVLLDVWKCLNVQSTYEHFLMLTCHFMLFFLSVKSLSYNFTLWYRTKASMSKISLNLKMI